MHLEQLSDEVQVSERRILMGISHGLLIAILLPLQDLVGWRQKTTIKILVEEANY